MVVVMASSLLYKTYHRNTRFFRRHKVLLELGIAQETLEIFVKKDQLQIFEHQELGSR